MQSVSQLMPDVASAPWEQFFPPPSNLAGAPMLRLRLVRKRGEPFLLLPEERALAASALSLYPAQTTRAKFARQSLRVGLRLAPLIMGEPVRLAVNSSSPFSRFLCRTAGTPTLPRLAMLLGNPRAPGRRFVLMLFNSAGTPAALVKAGAGNAAVNLIQSELGFLKTQPAGLLHAPQVLAECADENFCAFAMDYIDGTPPHPGNTHQAAALMKAWLQPERTFRFMELPVARRLEASAAGDLRWVAAAKALQDARFHPAIHHGDFAPWNVRVDAAGTWHVLDWERGEFLGPPAWDWFHWVIQHEILARHTPTNKLIRRIEALQEQTDFQQYVERAGIVGLVRPLLLAYLLYCSRVIRQADGLSAVEALLAPAAANLPAAQ